MSGLAVKAMGSLGDAASYFDHEMNLDQERKSPEPDRDPVIEIEQETARQLAFDAERSQAEAAAWERDAKEAQDRDAEARHEQEHEAEREREQEERDRQPDTSWQSSGVHAADEEHERSTASSLPSHEDDDRWTQPFQVRAGGVSAEELWAAQDRADHGDASALRADLREQYVSLGLTGSMADERLEKLEELVEKAAKLAERVTITRDEFTGELVWSVHNADREFGSDLERLQFQDRLKELEHLAVEYGVAFVRHDGPESVPMEFERGMNIREMAIARAGFSHDMDFDC